MPGDRFYLPVIYCTRSDRASPQNPGKKLRIDVDLNRIEQRAEDNARKFRRLNQRIMHGEGGTEENPDGE